MSHQPTLGKFGFATHLKKQMSKMKTSFTDSQVAYVLKILVNLSLNVLIKKVLVYILLLTKFFPVRSRASAINQREKTKIRNLQYGPRKQG